MSKTPRTDALMDVTSPIGFKGQAMVDLCRELEVSLSDVTACERDNFRRAEDNLRMRDEAMAYAVNLARKAAALLLAHDAFKDILPEVAELRAALITPDGFVYLPDGTKMLATDSGEYPECEIVTQSSGVPPGGDTQGQDSVEAVKARHPLHAVGQRGPYPRCDALQVELADLRANAWQSTLAYRELARTLEQELRCHSQVSKQEADRG